MKKFTSLLMLFLLFVGVGNAQKVKTIAGEPSDPKTMSSGYYVIKNVNAVRHSGRYVKNNNDVPYAFDKYADNNAALSGGYVWYLEISNQGVLISTYDKTKYWRLPKNDGGGVGPMENKNGQFLNFVAPSGNYTGNKDVKTNFPKAVQIQNKTAYDSSVGFDFSTYRANGEDGVGKAVGVVSGWQGTGDDQLFAEFYAVEIDNSPVVDNGPIVSSTLTKDGKFDQMHWYTFTLNGTTAIYEYFSDKTYLNNTYADKKTANKLFAFVGTKEGGYEIYNCVAGPSKILWSDGCPGKEGGTPIQMTNKSDAKSQTKFFLTTNENGWGLYKEGHTNAYLNSRDSYVAYWEHSASHNNAGSRLTFTEVPQSELAEYFNNYKDDLKKVSGCVGGFSAEVTDLIDAQMTDINNIGEFCSNHDRIVYKVNGLYNIRAQREVKDMKEWGPYLYSAPEVGQTGEQSTVQTGAHAGDLNAMWKLEASEGNVAIKNMNSGYVVGKPQNNNSSVLKCEGNVTYTLLPTRIYNGIYSLKISTEGQYLHELNQSQKNIRIYDKTAEADFGSAFCLLPVNEIKATVSDAKWATACWPVAVKVPAGVEVYYVNKVELDVIYVKQITDVVPANTPVLLFSEKAQEYKFAISATEGTPLAEGVNKLFGKTVKTAVAAGEYYGLIKNVSNATVFAPYTSDFVPANKVLLPKAALPAPSQHFHEFRIDFGEATGIENVETNQAKCNEYFDLNGRRVFYPVHGIYVNGNGQKVFIK